MVITILYMYKHIVTFVVAFAVVAMVAPSNPTFK